MTFTGHNDGAIIPAVEIPLALSLRQPLAWLVARGFKPLENRPWRAHVRGVFLIHASSNRKPYPLPEADYIKKRLDWAQWEDYQRAELAYGALIGAGVIQTCVDENTSYLTDRRFWLGPYALVVIKAHLFEKPIPCPGGQKWFTPRLDEAGREILLREFEKRGTLWQNPAQQLTLKTQS